MIIKSNGELVDLGEGLYTQVVIMSQRNNSQGVEAEILEGVFALYIAIIEGCTPERAFSILDDSEKGQHRTITIEDIEDMKKMKDEGMLQKDIAKFYFLKPYHISNHLKKLKGDKDK